ncbi:S9 family peptidase [uncultured Roseibium sp.]|uniref:S9 family peptidase n=1 Tax=uncultured Roseibium sp. TaxID=1936171 RepID=UPI0026357125|nr:S9 family peptidase [uncultured Roseibium sp.]
MAKLKHIGLGVLAGWFLTLPVLAQEGWTPERSLTVKHLSDVSFTPDGTGLLFGIQSIDLDNDQYLTEYVISDLNGASVRTLLPASPDNSWPQWSPDGALVAYLSSASGVSNIWVIPAEGGTGQALTDQTTDVQSFKWAPDGNAIAFVIEDPSYVPPPLNNADDYVKNQLWMVLLSDGAPDGAAINLTPDADFSISGWTGNWTYDWAPDGSAIVFAHQERPGLDYMTEARLSITEVATQTVTPMAPDNDHWQYFPRWSPDGKYIAFLNAPGEFMWSFLWDIKLLPVEGGDLVELARTKNRLPFIWQWAADSQSVYYLENDRVSYSFYEMPIDGSDFTKIFGAPEDIDAPGLNTYLTSPYIHVSPDNTQLAYIGQTSSTPPAIYLSDVDDFSPEKISTANDPYLEVPLGTSELIQWTSLDGTEVEAILSYPPDYQEGQSYPMVVQIHGGPNAVDFNEYLPVIKYFATANYTAAGYVVLRVNYRGTLGYGRAFREDLIGNFGGPDYEDIMTGLDHVVDLGIADPDQLFVVGQSNGGTLTNWIVTKTERFKSACSIAGETDYISLEGTNGFFQTSWYLGGSFIDNLQMFIERSPIFHVKNVTTPILIQGGLLDDNVPYTQLEEFYRALKRAGAEAHLVGYPGATHESYTPKQYLQLLRSCLDWTNSHRAAEAN